MNQAEEVTKCELDNEQIVLLVPAILPSPPCGPVGAARSAHRLLGPDGAAVRRLMAGVAGNAIFSGNLKEPREI